MPASEVNTGATVPKATSAANTIIVMRPAHSADSRDSVLQLDSPAESADQRVAISPAPSRRLASRKPSSGGPMPELGNEWTENFSSAPLRVSQVPASTASQASIASIRLVRTSARRVRWMSRPWSSATATSHGTSEAFSTGSQPQYPPQPSTL